MEVNTIICGDAGAILKTFPNESIDMVLTSPPYWKMRDYKVDGQLGLEKTPNEYVKKLCNVFDQVKLLLKQEGTVWVNIGDVYGTGSGSGSRKGSKQNSVRGSVYYEKTGKEKVKNYEKSLLQLPFRFSIEMARRGWILRNTIIWHKPNAMPESVKDRFTEDFEYLFFFTKNKKYYFEQQFEPHLTKENRPDGIIRQRTYNYKGKYGSFNQIQKWQKNEKSIHGEQAYGKLGRNKRSVWTIPTKAFNDAHFAVYPEELCRIPILAGCPKGGIVLDPFIGSGTTAVVARKYGRKFIGIELNEQYVKIANKRLAQQMFHL